MRLSSWTHGFRWHTAFLWLPMAAAMVIFTAAAYPDPAPSPVRQVSLPARTGDPASERRTAMAAENRPNSIQPQDRGSAARLLLFFGGPALPFGFFR
jgi:hypothetical protein